MQHFSVLHILKSSKEQLSHLNDFMHAHKRMKAKKELHEFVKQAARSVRVCFMLHEV